MMNTKFKSGKKIIIFFIVIIFIAGFGCFQLFEKKHDFQSIFEKKTIDYIKEFVSKNTFSKNNENELQFKTPGFETVFVYGELSVSQSGKDLFIQKGYILFYKSEQDNRQSLFIKADQIFLVNYKNDNQAYLSGNVTVIDYMNGLVVESENCLYDFSVQGIWAYEKVSGSIDDQLQFNSEYFYSKLNKKYYYFHDSIDISTYSKYIFRLTRYFTHSNETIHISGDNIIVENLSDRQSIQSITPIVIESKEVNIKGKKFGLISNSTKSYLSGEDLKYEFDYYKNRFSGNSVNMVFETDYDHQYMIVQGNKGIFKNIINDFEEQLSYDKVVFKISEHLKYGFKKIKYIKATNSEFKIYSSVLDMDVLGKSFDYKFSGDNTNDFSLSFYKGKLDYQQLENDQTIKNILVQSDEFSGSFKSSKIDIKFIQGEVLWDSDKSQFIALSKQGKIIENEKISLTQNAYFRLLTENHIFSGSKIDINYLTGYIHVRKNGKIYFINDDKDYFYKDIRNIDYNIIELFGEGEDISYNWGNGEVELKNRAYITSKKMLYPLTAAKIHLFFDLSKTIEVYSGNILISDTENYSFGKGTIEQWSSFQGTGFIFKAGKISLRSDFFNLTDKKILIEGNIYFKDPEGKIKIWSKKGEVEYLEKNIIFLMDNKVKKEKEYITPVRFMYNLKNKGYYEYNDPTWIKRY